MTRSYARRAGALLFAAVLAAPLGAQQVDERPNGARRLRTSVHGPSLVGNLSGDSPDREVTVWLPPSYQREPDRRFPVIYMLHGYTDDDLRWFGWRQHWIDLAAVLDDAIRADGVREFIVVMPNAYTRFQGSMYSNSVTTGNWEDFVARDLVAWVDANYRTIANVASRGLAGHSMGGYGTLRIGMKHPDVFGSIYALSPCCLAPRTVGPESAAANARAEAVTDMEQFARSDFGTRATIASAAAWAPNPGNPPFYLDLPTKSGEPQPRAIARFAANAPLAMVDQYVSNLNALRGVAFDSGDRDHGIANTIIELNRILDDFGVPHFFEIYPGDHLSGVAERIRTKVMPFFSRTLITDAGR
jgi:enterochelin esterase-like enzyme